MHYDNPAARLVEILEDGKSLSGDMSCRKAWGKLLNADPQSGLLLSRLGKVMELPEETIETIKAEHPEMGEVWGHWLAQVSTAFATQNLNGQWATFNNHIDAISLSQLKVVAKLLQATTPVAAISTQDLASLKAQVEELYSAVLNAEIPDEVRKYLAFYLRRLRITLDEYRITGAMPILETVYAAAGSTYANNTHADIKATVVGARFFGVLAGLANAVTVAQGLPKLAKDLLKMIQ